MKKFFPILLLFLCLNFTTVKAAPAITSNILKQGVYEANDIINALGNVRTVQNISSNNPIYFILIDDKETVIQAIKMSPNSPKYNLNKLDPNYKIIIVGKGSVFFS